MGSALIWLKNSLTTNWHYCRIGGGDCFHHGNVFTQQGSMFKINGDMIPYSGSPFTLSVSVRENDYLFKFRGFWKRDNSKFKKIFYVILRSESFFKKGWFDPTSIDFNCICKLISGIKSVIKINDDNLALFGFPLAFYCAFFYLVAYIIKAVVIG